MTEISNTQPTPSRFSATEEQGSERIVRVIVVGAGFGGLWAARALANDDVAVRLLDKNNYHTFLPLLYQVAAAELEPGLIARSVRSLVRRQANVRFAMTAVQRIDLDGQVVYGADQAFPYDYLILALGSVNHFFSVPGAEANCFTLKSLEEGIALRNHILHCVEKASQLASADADERRRLLTFVIIGGGPTGVEYAGALAELLFQPLTSDYPEIRLHQEAQVILVEATDQLVPGVGGEYARKRLTAMGVDVRLNCAVAEIAAERVVLAGGGAIATASPVWTAGVSGTPLEGAPPFTRVRGGRIPVRPTLQTVSHDNVFVIGDIVFLIGFRNRLGVLLNWAWNYIFYERAVRLILPQMPSKSDNRLQ